MASLIPLNAVLILVLAIFPLPLALSPTWFLQASSLPWLLSFFTPLGLTRVEMWVKVSVRIFYIIVDIMKKFISYLDITTLQLGNQVIARPRTSVAVTLLVAFTLVIGTDNLSNSSYSNSNQFSSQFNSINAKDILLPAPAWSTSETVESNTVDKIEVAEDKPVIAEKPFERNQIVTVRNGDTMAGILQRLK